MAIKIAYIITRADDFGGAQAHLVSLAAKMQERGHTVVVLAGGTGPLFKELSRLKIAFQELKHLVHPLNPFKDLAAIFEARSFLKKFKPDLVATHSNKAGFVGRLAAFSLKLPAVHTSHGFLFLERPKSFTGRFYRLAEKLAAVVGQMVICVSQSEYNTAAAFKVIPPNKMLVVHNGLQDFPESFRAQPEKEPVRLIMVARFAPPKDQAALLYALAGLKELKFNLQFVGDGKGLVAAKALAQELGLSEKTEFLGTRSDVNLLLVKANIFVLSSRREGFPISILEAMRAALPVVAAEVGGVAEAVIDKETGFLFAAGSAEELRAHLKELILKPALRKELGQAGRKRFLANFSLEKQVEETAEVYQKALKAPLKY